MFGDGGGYNEEKKRREEERMKMGGLGGMQSMLASAGGGGGGMPRIPMGAIRGGIGRYGDMLNNFRNQYSMDFSDLSQILNSQNTSLDSILGAMNKIPNLFQHQPGQDPQISNLVGNLGNNRGRLPPGINLNTVSNYRDALSGYRR